MTNPSHKSRANAMRVLFWRYLRERGLNPCGSDCNPLPPDELRFGIAPADPLTYLLFVEWLLDYPGYRAEVEQLEAVTIAAAEAA